MRLSRHKPSLAILALGAAAALAFSSASAQTSGRTLRPVDDAETKPKLERVTAPTKVPEAMTRPTPVVGTPVVPQRSASNRSPEQAATGAGMGRAPSAKEAAAIGAGRTAGAGSTPNPVGQGPAINLAAPPAVTVTPPDVPRTVDARAPGQRSPADLKSPMKKPPLQVQVLDAPPVQAYMPILEPQDQQQAPAASDPSPPSQVQYFVPVGTSHITPVAGKADAVRKVIELDNAFVHQISWKEVGNRPCRIEITGTRVWAQHYINDTDQDGFMSARVAEANFSCGGLIQQTKHIQVPPDTPIFSVQVCNNNKKNHRLKGIRISGRFINPADTARMRPGGGDEESMPNCRGGWGQIRYCPANMRVTGFVVHAKDAGGNNNAGITGLQLICREIAVR